MSVLWKKIDATVPKDRKIYLWDDEEGPVLVEWREGYRPGWNRTSLLPNITICYTSLRPNNWTHWCEVSEMKPS